MHLVRSAALAVTAALVLGGCGLAEARQAAIADAAVKPIDPERGLRPGLVGMPDYPASGWAPSDLPGAGVPSDDPLAAIGLQADDVTKGNTVAIIPDGRSLGIPTLDFCEGDFPSEDLRVSRLQVGAYDAAGTYAGLSTEVVEYESAAAAQQAIDELVTARRACPEDTRIDTFDGHTLRFHFQPAPGPSSTPLVEAGSRVILHATMQVDGEPHTTFLVYQVVGKVLAALYVSDSSGKPLAQDVLDGLYGLAGSIADRLREQAASTTSA